MKEVLDGEVPWRAGDPDGLPVVEFDSPAAVLLVDLRTRAVVQANDVAEQLAPTVRLPAPVDAWSDAADLRDLAGADLSDTAHPLSRLAGGLPVAGQGVTAARTSELGRERAPLWVVGVPLGGDRLDGFGLVVFLPLRRREEVTAMTRALQAETRLRERALVATGVTFTIADAQAEDHPLLWVNPAFTTVTGYTPQEAVGRNCRFLQGPDTDPDARALLRDALAKGEPVTTTLLNYRKDGTAFWNFVAINPVHDEDGRLTHFVGIQNDVTSRVTADADRERALTAERAARADAVRAQDQLALLAAASVELSASLDVDAVLACLLRLTVPALADWAMVTTFDETGGISDVVALHQDGRDGDVEELVHRSRDSLTQRAPMHQHRRGAGGWLVERYRDHPERAGYTDDPMLLQLSERLGLDSVMFVPLPGRRHVIGSMVLARGPGRSAFNDQDLRVGEDLGRRAGLTLDNARLYEAEHHIAETLQRSLLPELPAVQGLEIAARYRAGLAIAEVGGDFYDVIPLTDGSIALAVGDVVGHDLAAAAAMGHLRGMLRACAWETGRSPGVVLERVDRIVQGLQTVPMATLLYAALTPRPGGGWVVEYASAGHPPMLLRHPDGSVETLDRATGLLLGVEAAAHRTGAVTADPGSLLLAYTDGLVERRGEDLALGIERVRAALAAACPERPDELCETLLAGSRTEDDTAVLAIHVA